MRRIGRWLHSTWAPYVVVVVAFCLALWAQTADSNRDDKRIAAVSAEGRERLCDHINEMRAAERRLWEPVLLGSPPPTLPPDPTPAQREHHERQSRIRAEFERTLRTDFAPLDCP